MIHRHCPMRYISEIYFTSHPIASNLDNRTPMEIRLNCPYLPPKPRGSLAVPPPLFLCAFLFAPDGAQTPFCPAIPRGFEPVTARVPPAPLASLMALPYLEHAVVRIVGSACVLTRKYVSDIPSHTISPASRSIGYTPTDSSSNS
jgi:hypothetical protein